MGIVPLGELHAERDTLIRQVASLRARFGPGGTYDDLRKIELARIAQLLRASFVRDGVKFTEAQIDEAAHAHPDYVEHVTSATLDRAKWVELENRIQSIDETVNRGQAVARFVANELRLEPGGP